VLPITPEIASLSPSHAALRHQDTADRLIAATTIFNEESLVTCDGLLRKIKGLQTIW